MRRKNRKWAAIAVVLYLGVMVAAYRWAVNQRVPEGNIFVKIEREGVRHLADEKAKAEAAAPKPTGESRLTAAGPAFVAARYDRTHVVFMVATETEARFSGSAFTRTSNSLAPGGPVKIPASPQPAASLAGLQELWAPDSQSLHFFPKIVQQTQPGEQWTLSVSPDLTIPVAIDRVVVAPVGCSLALGFLASVAPEQQAAFAARGEYFAVRRNPVASVDPPVASDVSSRIGELPDWKASPAMAKQIVRDLNDRLKVEVAKIDARLMANAGSPGETAGQTLGDARPRTREWLHADQGLRRGEGTLDYGIHAYRLTPDGVPRLFVRARWKLADTTVFLMTAWFRANTPSADPPKLDGPGGDTPNAPPPSAAAQPLLLSVDSSWSTSLRQGADGTLADSLDFQTILNEFDADHDGWAELLIHSRDTGSGGNTSTAITLYLYTDLGLVPMKTPLRRSAQSPESCLDSADTTE